MSKEESSEKEEVSPLFVEKIVTRAMFGHLVGKTKEVIEAVASDKVQRESLKNVMADMMYKWWNDLDAGEGRTIYPGTREYIDK